jgi:hypothetical protein
MKAHALHVGVRVHMLADVCTCGDACGDACVSLSLSLSLSLSVRARERERLCVCVRAINTRTLWYPLHALMHACVYIYIQTPKYPYSIPMHMHTSFTYTEYSIPPPFLDPKP